jgi:glycosyltransferase involved in cell wall biosynthesis
VAAVSTYSLVIPVYRNAGSIPELVAALEALDVSLGGRLEVVFVVDGSPDESYALLSDALPSCGFRSQLLLLSRNFGSFAAIREGLRAAHGSYFAVMAADLQEPPELIRRFFEALEGEPVDVVFGRREGRADPLPSRLAASAFWGLYRRLVQPDLPPGGVDVFGCNLAFREQLLAMDESNTSLVGLLFWMGFRRKTIGYARQARKVGKSAWTLKRKLKYLSDSIYAFSDLPIRVLTFAGALGLVCSTVISAVVLTAKVVGGIPVPGYAATVLIVTFFAALNSFGLGVIGAYVWRTYENTKRRPLAIVMQRRSFEGRARGATLEEAR